MERRLFLKKNDDESSGGSIRCKSCAQKQETKVVVNEVEIAAFSGLSEEGPMAMKKSLEVMATFCCIYEVDFINSIVEHKQNAREDVNGKVELVLVPHSYNIPRDRNADDSEYDLFTSDDMRDMAMIQGDAMKPGTHGHLYCSSLQFFFRYKAMVSEFTEERTTIDSYQENSGSESEESATVEKQEVFEIETTALDYTSAVGNHQQRIATKRAAYRLGVEMAIYF